MSRDIKAIETLFETFVAGVDQPPMTDRSVAWAAGLFEGEGCITHSTSYKTTARGKLQIIQPRMSLSMIDADVVYNFWTVVKVGGLNAARQPEAAHHKKQYTWRCGSLEDFLTVWDMLKPFLFTRRKEQAYKVLNAYACSQEELGKDVSERVLNEMRQMGAPW